VLGNLAPVILAHQATGTIGAVWLNTAQPSQQIGLGDYTVTCALRRSTSDMLLNYDLAGQSQLNQSGSGLRFLSGAPVIQRVHLYRYQ
jgi:hypothetical protein